MNIPILLLTPAITKEQDILCNPLTKEDTWQRLPLPYSLILGIPHSGLPYLADSSAGAFLKTQTFLEKVGL